MIIVHELIRNIENLQDLQLDVDIELMENGGEMTPELEKMQNTIDAMTVDLVKDQTDTLIQSLSYLGGRLDTLKSMQTDLLNSRKSLEKFIERVKRNVGVHMAKASVGKASGDLGSVKVIDRCIIGEIKKELVEPEYMYVIVKYEKVDYDAVEFKLGEIISEISRKEEVNETKAKAHCANGVELIETKSISVYKKRGSKAK